jgi:sugar transferase (PEP-CTERM/EpsH1 system associated)
VTAAAAPPCIAHVIFRLDFGGLQNGLVNLLNRMPHARYRHAIICLDGFDPAFRQRLRRDDVELIVIGKRPGKDPAAYGRVWRALRRLRPAIVHTRNLGTVDQQWVAAAAGVRLRLHGEHGWEASDPLGRDPRGLRIRRACRPVIQRYVPMSRDLARWLEDEVGVRPERIRQAYNGVDVDRFRPATPVADPAPAQRFRIGTVGRLDPVKNHAALLQAFHDLVDGRPDLAERSSLVVVGDGPLREALEARAGALGLQGRVEFTGSRDDTPELVRSFDLFVLPSLNEGISNTILEAMASGVPVLATRVGGNPELVVDGTTGTLCPPGDPRALVEGMARYADDGDRRRAHGAAGRARAVAQFSLDAMVTRYLDIYDEISCAA